MKGDGTKHTRNALIPSDVIICGCGAVGRVVVEVKRGRRTVRIIWADPGSLEAVRVLRERLDVEPDPTINARHES